MDNDGVVAKSGEGSRLISERCEGSNPSSPTCEIHNEEKVLYGTKLRCKSCNRDYQRKWFADNKETQLARTRANRVAVRQRNMEHIWAYKLEHPCVDCGEVDPVVLDFDHLGDKSFGIASCVSDISFDKLRAEIAKCEVRCANCHRRKTAKEQGRYAYLST